MHILQIRIFRNYIFFAYISIGSFFGELYSFRLDFFYFLEFLLLLYIYSYLHTYIYICVVVCKQ